VPGRAAVAPGSATPELDSTHMNGLIDDKKRSVVPTVQSKARCVCVCVCVLWHVWVTLYIDRQIFQKCHAVRLVSYCNQATNRKVGIDEKQNWHMGGMAKKDLFSYYSNHARNDDDDFNNLN